MREAEVAWGCLWSEVSVAGGVGWALSPLLLWVGGTSGRLLGDHGEQGFSHLGEQAPSRASGQSRPHRAIMGTVGMRIPGGGGEPSCALAWVPPGSAALAKALDCPWEGGSECPLGPRALQPVLAWRWVWVGGVELWPNLDAPPTQRPLLR